MKAKILVVGPALSMSGYGVQARFALKALRKHEDKFDIYLRNTRWGQTGELWEDTEERDYLIELLRKTELHLQQPNQQFDVSLQVTIPNEFQKIALVNIGYTAGIETNKIAPEWIEKCNMMDKIITVSQHSKDVLVDTVYEVVDQLGQKHSLKIDTPVDYVNYGHVEVEEEPLDLKLDYEDNFLAISQFGPRKNLLNTIMWFVEAFRDKEVGLVVKTFGRRNSNIDFDQLKRELKVLMERLGEKTCQVILLHGSLSSGQMKSLYKHPKIKGFVNLAHGEGFGLPMFEAACAGLPVIAPCWSGQVDFLTMPVKVKNKLKVKPMMAKVAFDIGKVQQEAVWRGVVTPDSSWCYPQKSSYVDRLKDVLRNEERYQNQAKKLQKHLLENFKEADRLDEFAESVLGTKEVSKLARNNEIEGLLI